jgi:hypothetical protein
MTALTPSGVYLRAPMPMEGNMQPWCPTAMAVYLPMLAAALASGDIDRAIEICTSPDIPASRAEPVLTDPSDRRN